MKGQVIVGVHRQTESIMPIDMVILTGLKCDCICFDCKGVLEAVLNTSRKKHFRHSNRGNCNPTPETELHLLAKKIILDHEQLFIPCKGMVVYTDPKTEVWFNNLVPDATVYVEGVPLYIEIVVTNPISTEKYLKYKANRSSVLVINLSKEDRELDYGALVKLVIHQHTNRYMLSYAERPVKKIEDDNFSWLPWGLLAGLAIWLFKTSSTKKPRYRKYRKF